MTTEYCEDCGIDNGHLDICPQVQRSREPAGYGLWQPIETLKVGGDAVLLFAEEWKDPDFNPTGVREGFRNESDDGPIYSARWNDCHECWETVINHEATHWMPRPAGL
ncbi:MAG: hypothetical protein AB2777_20615 [Candidatus Thiodiazotropha endolucinida]